MTPQEAFQILGISPETPRARGHAAYRELVKLWHPDRYSPGSALRETAERNTRRANQAWQVVQPLLPSRASVGRTGASGAPTPGGGGGAPAAAILGPALLETLARLVQRLGPLARRLQLDGFLHWLGRERPAGHRPWYRYPEAEERKSAFPARPFDQMLAEALGERRRRGAVLRGARFAGRRSGPRSLRPVDPPGPVSPVRPSRRSGMVEPIDR